MSASPWLTPITLTGNHVELIPLAAEHADALVEAATDGELWNLWFTSVPNADSVKTYIDSALKQQKQGVALAFAVVEKTSGQIIGSSRYCNVDNKNQRLEIGYTWYARRCQRTPVNTEAKLLLLTHAFEQCGAIAVEFRTHWHNQASRAAIARLGAKQDGVLRNHQRMADGSLRDTVVFSIIESEWPGVKTGLKHKLKYRPVIA